MFISALKSNLLKGSLWGCTHFWCQPPVAIQRRASFVGFIFQPQGLRLLFCPDMSAW